MRVAARHVVIFFTILVMMAASPVMAGGASPRAVVEQFHKALITAMQRSQDLKFAGRYQTLAPAIQDSFHLPLMMRVAAGTSWRRATPEQRDLMVQAFKHMSVSTYASRFDGFSGESFETVREREGPQKTVLVETRLNRSGGDPVTLTYVTKQFKNDWRIVDILLAGGISELAVRHSEYRKILRDAGVGGLVTTLNARAAKLATNP